MKYDTLITDCNYLFKYVIIGDKMKSFKKVILMILLFSVTNFAVNCSFRRKLNSRSMRSEENIGEHRSRLSTESSFFSRRSIMKLLRSKIILNSCFNEDIPIEDIEKVRNLNRLEAIDNLRERRSVRLSTFGSRDEIKSRHTLPKLTEFQGEGSDEIISILADNHEKQEEISDFFINFIDHYFRFNDDESSFVFYKDMMIHDIKEVISFSDLRKIYSDAILANVEFIKKIFEQEIFFDIEFEYRSTLNIRIPVYVLLMFDIFEGLYDDCISTHSFSFSTEYELSLNIKLMFEAISRGRLQDIRNLVTGNARNFLLINQKFIVECFVRDIENKDLESIENFVRFVVRNFEEDDRKSILFRCLEILNPKYYNRIINYLDNDYLVNLGELSITAEQLAFLIPFLLDFKFIYLFKNCLNLLPKSIGELNSLIHLDLKDNQLTCLPKNIGNLINLKTFDISNNQLTGLSESIRNLKNLNVLDLRGNLLEGSNQLYCRNKDVLAFINSYFNSSRRSFFSFLQGF